MLFADTALVQVPRFDQTDSGISAAVNLCYFVPILKLLLFFWLGFFFSFNKLLLRTSRLNK